MKDLLPLRGVLSTFITPFTEDNKIDIDSLHKEIELGIQQGVTGFLIPCDAAEAEWLTTEEMTTLVREAHSVAKDRCVLISNVNGADRDTRMKQCESFLANGVDALNLNLKFRADRTEDEYMAAVADIDSFKPKFMLIQDSDREGTGLPIETIIRAFNEVESVRGVKIEVKNNGKKYSKVRELTDGRMHISCARGRDQLIEAYDRGIHCFLPAGMFTIYVNSFKLYHEKSREAAVKLFYDMAPIMLFTNQSGWVNECMHKEYFKQIGIFKTTKARHGDVLDSYQARICQDMIDQILKIESQIESYWE